jgi:hypothetical protein
VDTVAPLYFDSRQLHCATINRETIRYRPTLVSAAIKRPLAVLGKLGSSLATSTLISINAVERLLPAIQQIITTVQALFCDDRRPLIIAIPNRMY